MAADAPNGAFATEEHPEHATRNGLAADRRGFGRGGTHRGLAVAIVTPGARLHVVATTVVVRLLHRA